MLLIDIGSTYTKVAVVDETARQIVATDCSPTTIQDVGIGFNEVVLRIKAHGVPDNLLAERYASSSAAGGLRMVAVGLVPELTMEAARRAALGAGAKVVANFSFSLMSRQIAEIEATKPDIILLAGGTDGGDTKTVIHNAGQLARSPLDVPIVFAGNREAADAVAALLEAAHKEIHIAENVMPTVSRINVDSVREVIREVFLRRIIVAKGLDKIRRHVDAMVCPTPLAVLEAARILSKVTGQALLVLDVGGATTDVHSIGEGTPSDPQVVFKGLPEPFAKRTVEGDIGVRYNISIIVDTIGKKQFLLDPCLGAELDLAGMEQLVSAWGRETSSLPQNETEESFDRTLAAAAVEIAVNRHVGYLEEMWTPMGKILLQYGKDLTGAKLVIGTGGPLVHNRRPRVILERALYDARSPLLLKPRHPEFFVDTRYVLFALGLISAVHPESCEAIARNYLDEMRLP